MNQVREALHYYHYVGKAEIKAFLSHLAVNRNVVASTRNQALSAFPRRGFIHSLITRMPKPPSIASCFIQITLEHPHKSRSFSNHNLSNPH